MCRHLFIRVLVFFLAFQFSPLAGAVFWFDQPLSDFSDSAYQEVVRDLLEKYTERHPGRLEPGPTGVVALKVYTASGPGLATPHSLVRALIEDLEKRGFPRSSQRIVDLRASSLRESGFLPPLSVGGSTFHGVPVIALEEGHHFEAEWFYESPLPPRRSALPGRSLGADFDLEEEARGDDRKSYLPTNLLFDVDFWINLPVAVDHPHLGLSGTLVNGTLWNASNTFRFFRSRSTGPIAIANMAAIPELREGWRLNIVSLERAQFIGGPQFNSLYTIAEPRIIASDDPVALDSSLIEHLNKARLKAGFRLIPGNLPYLLYAEQLDLGQRLRTR